VAEPDNVVPFSAIKKQKDKDAPSPLLGIEFGVERHMPFSSWGVDGEVLQAPKVPIDELVDMRRRDGQAKALMRLFTLPILASMADGKWVMADDDGEDGDGPEVEFANMMWNLPPQAGGMSTSKMSVLKKTLQALSDGFAVFEEVRHIPTEGDLAGMITLKKLAYRDPRTITFRADDNGGFNGVRQVSYKPNGITVDVRLDPTKVWYYACQEEENPFYGVSLFEAAYEHHTIKRKLYYIAHLAAQFAAVPGRMGTFPLGADPRQVADFKNALANFAFNTAMTMPEGWKVEPFNANSQFDFLKLIEHHNQMMSKSVLAAFIDDDSRAALVEVNSGSEPAADFFMMGLDAIMDDIAESWSTHLMPKYIDWNFGTKKYPVFRFGKITDAAKDTVKELFTAVVTSSVLNSTPEFVREMEKKLATQMDLDIDYDKIEKQEKEAAEEAELAQAEEAKMMEEQQAAGIDPATGQPADPNLPPGSPGGPPQPGAPQPPQFGGGAPVAPKKKKPTAAGTPGAPVGLSAEQIENPTIDDLVAMAATLLDATDDDDPSPV
jgi:hypothetical protein